MGRNGDSGNEEESGTADSGRQPFTGKAGKLLLGWVRLLRGRLRCLHPWMAAGHSGEGVRGDSASQAAHQHEYGIPLPSLHHTVPHFPSSFLQTHANLICNVCEDEEAQKSCLKHPVTAVSLHTTAPYHQEMLLKLQTSWEKANIPRA